MGSGNTYTVTVRINGADSVLSCSVVEVAVGCSSCAGPVALAAGDLVSVGVTPTGNPTARALTWSAVFGP